MSGNNIMLKSKLNTIFSPQQINLPMSILFVTDCVIVSMIIHYLRLFVKSFFTKRKCFIFSNQMHRFPVVNVKKNEEYLNLNV